MLFYIILLVTVNSVQKSMKYLTLHFQLRNLAYSQKKLSTTFLTNYVG